MSLRSNSEQTADVRRHVQPSIDRSHRQTISDPIRRQRLDHLGVLMHGVRTDEPESAVTLLTVAHEGAASRTNGRPMPIHPR